MLATLQPFPIYNDLEGRPLSSGSVYYGVAGDNPVTAPITVYWDVNGTQPAAQPVRTLNGFTCRAGTPSNVYADGDYSVLVLDSKGRQVYYCRSAAAEENSVNLQQQIAANDSAIRGDIANSTEAAKGAGMEGFDPTLNYVARTVGAILQDSTVNVLAFMTQTQRAQVKSGSVSADLTGVILAAKSWAGNRPIYFPAGTYSFTGLSCLGWYGGIVGDGIGQTILKVRGAVTNALDFGESSDTIISPFILKGFTLDGNSLAVNGINVQYRHHSVIEDVYVIGCTSWGIVEKDAWLSRRRNVRTTGNTNGWWLVGSNHGSHFDGCVITGASGTHLLIQSAGTAADGNSALLFTGLTLTDGTGTGIDITASSVTFLGCYVGENIGGFVLIPRAGDVLYSGGSLFFGQTATSYLIAPVGGRTVIQGAEISGQTYGSTAYLCGQYTGGVWSLRDCQSAITVGGDQVFASDSLDYGPPGQVFTKRLGRLLSSSANNATRTELISGNSITCTCATVSAGTPNITITALLSATHPEWLDGSNAYLVVVYLSNAAFNARLSGSALGGAPTTVIGSLPSTGGVTKTYVKVDATLAAAAYDRLEFYRDNCAPGDYLKLQEVFLADSRMLNKGAGVLGNLYKC